MEDQILRAAVSKYGLTQWSRVASLLPKKTAKQAKARWNEYLNPTINKSEWSREEDDKLLSLAKLLPNQWRSISPIMGRTATLCVERYQKLLESALKGGESESEDELKLTGPGIESLPALGNAFESLPSRPDLEDMDEDEREMLLEAKSRLANTQGKKAKRKERERMLDESKRISLLQKRRELKAAGINVSLELKNRKKRKEFDYNGDIPHEHQPPPGLFETNDEDQANETAKAKFQNQVSLKGMSMKEVDDKIKKKNDEATKKASKQLIREILSAAQMFSEVDDLVGAKRRKLELPAPGDFEDENDGIEERILTKSKDLLATQDLKSTFSRNQAPLSNQALLSNQAAVVKSEEGAPKSVKVSRRKITEFVKNTFSKLPKPQNKVEIVLPNIELTDEPLAVIGSEKELQKLQLLQQVEEEKEKLRRSQVLQRGLKTPHPSTLRNVDFSSDLDIMIAAEVRALIKSDYTKFEDPSYGAILLDSVDEETYNQVKSDIEKEMRTGEKVELSDFLLPQTEEAFTQANDLIDQLDKAANFAEAKSLESFKEYDDEARAQYLRISQLASELAEQNTMEQVFSRIAQNEEVAIAMRSARLHELVDDISTAEARVSRAQ